MQQQFDNSIHNDSLLSDVTDHWAVVISPSTTWANYRHQADAFSMYQLLRQYGYDDDHIVLIVEDNLAYSQENKDFPGQIFVERGDPLSWGFIGKDVRENAVVDYHFSQLTPDDIADIMQGRQSERLPHVIHPDSTSNVFFFWSGHGGMNGGPLWGNEDSKVYFGKDRIRSIVEEMAGTAAANNSQFSILRSATSGDASLAKNSQFLDMLPNVPIGIFPEHEFEGEEVEDISDCTFFLYTDGLNEAENRQQEQFGNKRLFDILGNSHFDSARQLVDTLEAEVEKHRNGAEPNDDLTMMCLRIQKGTA